MEPDLAHQETDRSAAPSSGAPLNGTLEDNTPAGVLQVLSSQRETGAVRFSGDDGCTVYLHEGELYFAETAETAEDLAIALVRPGRLSADEWDSSTASGYPTETVGEALIDTGSISRDLLASVVLSVIYDPLIQLFRSPEGDFEFEPGIVHWIGPFRTFGVDAIVAEVRRRTREADEMAPVVPSLDAWVRSARTLPEDRPNVSLRRDDWEVVVSAANGRTVRELAVDLGRGRWSTARLVYRLASVQLVEVDAAPEGSEAAGSPAGDFTSFDGGISYDDAPAAPAADAPATFASDPATAGNGGFDGGITFDEPDTDVRALSDGPPPIDFSDFATPEADTETDDATEDASWSDSSWEPSGWSEPAADDATGTAEADDATTSWSATGDDWSSTDTFDPDAGFGTDTDDATRSDDAFGAPLAAVEDPAPSWEPDSFEQPAAEEAATFEAPALHPDIAKALAESTYADSATAINAMAARLGASSDDEDDDDTWEASGDDDTSGFWSADGDASDFSWESQSTGGEAAETFTWEPAVWEVEVESTPLPQREHVAAEAGASAPGASDPQWLENLYSQFMPTGDAKAAAEAKQAQDQNLAADVGAAPKAKTLRRLMSAIKRL